MPVSDAVAEPQGNRDIFLDGRTVPRQGVSTAPRSPVGFTFDGPAIVEQYDTTVFVTRNSPSGSTRIGN